MTDGAACAINLDRTGTRRRLVLGIVASLVGAAVAVAAIARHEGLLWRLPALAALAFGALCLLQARAKT